MPLARPCHRNKRLRAAYFGPSPSPAVAIASSRATVPFAFGRRPPPAPDRDRADSGNGGDRGCSEISVRRRLKCVESCDGRRISGPAPLKWPESRHSVGKKTNKRLRAAYLPLARPSHRNKRLRAAYFAPSPSPAVAIASSRATVPFARRRDRAIPSPHRNGTPVPPAFTDQHLWCRQPLREGEALILAACGRAGSPGLGSGIRVGRDPGSKGRSTSSYRAPPVLFRVEPSSVSHTVCILRMGW